MPRGQRQPQMQRMPQPQLSSVQPTPEELHLSIMADRQSQSDRQLQAIREMAVARRQQEIELQLELQKIELMRQRGMR